MIIRVFFLSSQFSYSFFFFSFAGQNSSLNTVFADTRDESVQAVLEEEVAAEMAGWCS
jgi:hypothetical protein